MAADGPLGGWGGGGCRRARRAQPSPSPLNLPPSRLLRAPRAGAPDAANRRGLRTSAPAAARKADKAGGGKADKAAGGAAAGGAAGAAAAEVDGYGGERDAVRITLQAIENVKPFLTVRSKKVAAKVVFVPGTLTPAQQQSLALRWLVQAAAARKASAKADFAECLALELLLAAQRKGAARQKRDDVHKLALQNRANINQRWW
jgi:small subunit ribosomal protein S7